MSSRRRRFCSEVADRQYEVVRLCQELIRIPSPNPPGDTRAIVTAVERMLQSADIEAERYEPMEGMPNLIATIGGPSPTEYDLIINGHLDHFPPASGEWQIGGPYSGEICDGHIVGCGSTDMRGGLAISVFLALVLNSYRDAMEGRVHFVYSSDEETGGAWGTRWLLENVADLKSSSGCLVVDQSGLKSPAIGEKGACWLSVRVEGVRGHGAYRYQDGAARRLCDILQAILELERIPRVDAGMTGLRSQDIVVPAGITVNIGTVMAGEKVNLAPGSAVAEIDVRVPVGCSSSGVVDEIRRAAHERHPSATVTEIMVTEPTLTPPSARLVEHVMRALAMNENSRDDGAAPVIRVGASDARHFRQAGIPTVVLGASANSMGAVDEQVSINELMKLTSTYASIVSELIRP